MSLEGLELVRVCRELALEKKAVDPVILDLNGLNGPAEWFLICSGESDPQIKAIAQSIEVGLKQDHNIRAEKVDGKSVSQWIVLDYGSVLVHVMHASKRDYYQLEKLWRDAARVE